MSRRSYLPERLDDLRDEGRSLDSELLAAVTHKTNLPYSWRHISLDVVAQAALRAQLASTILRSKESKEAKEGEDLTEYVALLESAMDQLSSKDASIEALRNDVDDRDSEIDRLQAAVDSLRHALSGRQSPSGRGGDDLVSLSPLRDAVAALADSKPTLEQSLVIITSLFPERIVVLDSAYASARESREFRYGSKGFDLLWKLVTGYWEALNNGRGDGEAKTIFGKSDYAPNEGGALSKDGERRRTFRYRERDFVMEKHLKDGIKDSIAETLRVHFEWMGHEKKLVIGHCGKHLDF